MRLDYSEIMALPRPSGALDISALVQIWELYTLLLRRYLARDYDFEDPRNIKRVRYYRRMVAATLRDLRQGKMYNFALRVKFWVLSSRRRRLQVRALIGEDKITRWQAQVEARLCAGTGDMDAPAQVDAGDKTHILGHINFPRGLKIGPWYRLPTLPAWLTNGTNSNPVAEQVSGAGAPRNSLHRAMPAIPFWPHELVEDYIADDEALVGFGDAVSGRAHIQNQALGQEQTVGQEQALGQNQTLGQNPGTGMNTKPETNTPGNTPDKPP